MKTYEIKVSGVVVNTIVWDGVTPYALPVGAVVEEKIIPVLLPPGKSEAVKLAEAGVTHDTQIEALWTFARTGDATAVNALQAKIDQVKNP